MFKIKNVNEVDIRFYVVIRVEEVFIIIVIIFLFEMIMIILLCIINVLL